MKRKKKTKMAKKKIKMKMKMKMKKKTVANIRGKITKRKERMIKIPVPALPAENEVLPTGRFF